MVDSDNLEKPTGLETVPSLEDGIGSLMVPEDFRHALGGFEVAVVAALATEGNLSIIDTAQQTNPNGELQFGAVAALAAGFIKAELASKGLDMQLAPTLVNTELVGIRLTAQGGGFSITATTPLHESNQAAVNQFFKDEGV